MGETGTRYLIAPEPREFKHEAQQGGASDGHFPYSSKSDACQGDSGDMLAGQSLR